jgi:hypothetical protein
MLLLVNYSRSIESRIIYAVGIISVNFNTICLDSKKSGL